ncbi:hypothetical protein Rhopal_000516-T1 [Rhodotorula paludigena]|uniref:XLF-domain-containing protein n=1 Tax=Rhodotorula paludigena TaxID=86838 RepID=A0AAV5GER4_9BASI|nr:hypothetical protein Rhopal_000516-T1 [Rhodotorula paludigena]
MEWDEVNRLFLPISWSSFPTSDDSNLLLKLLPDPKKGGLSLMATDLENVYFESLSRRQLTRRIDDALSNSADSQSQGVVVGIGEDGAKLLQESVDKLLSAHIVSITVTGGFTIKFLTSSLEHQSSAALAAHLVNPLLGVCSSLLALLRDSSGSDDALLKRIELAIDSSGTAERMDEGRATKRFMSVGGPALLQRWTQRSVGAKEKDLQPVTLSLPSRSQRPFSPAQSQPPPPTPKRKASASPAPEQPPPRKASHVSPSPPKPPASSIAQRMLDHHGGEKGERVGWDDSQRSSRSSTSAKGKDRAPSPMAIEEPAARAAEAPVRATESDEDEEPATEDDEGPTGALPPPQQRRRSPSPLGFPPLRSSHPSSSAASPPPPTATSDISDTLDAPQADRAPTPSPSPAEDAAAKKRRRQEEEQAAEEQAEKERRKARLQKMSAAPAAASKKKKLKKL